MQTQLGTLSSDRAAINMRTIHGFDNFITGNSFTILFVVSSLNKILELKSMYVTK